VVAQLQGLAEILEPERVLTNTFVAASRNLSLPVTAASA